MLMRPARKGDRNGLLHGRAAGGAAFFTLIGRGMRRP